MDSLGKSGLLFDPIRPEPHSGVCVRASVLGFETNTNRNRLIELITGQWHLPGHSVVDVRFPGVERVDAKVLVFR
ncbi:hypothetical protein [Thalassoglobus sp.]|uniref:hypothetical protein n=1 Tax=Thalassoglobus sp. TaxID=2795869 RepID=UPI003AA82A9C